MSLKSTQIYKVYYGYPVDVHIIQKRCNECNYPSGARLSVRGPDDMHAGPYENHKKDCKLSPHWCEHHTRQHEPGEECTFICYLCNLKFNEDTGEVRLCDECKKYSHNYL